MATPGRRAGGAAKAVLKALARPVPQLIQPDGEAVLNRPLYVAAPPTERVILRDWFLGYSGRWPELAVIPGRL